MPDAETGLGEEQEQAWLDASARCFDGIQESLNAQHNAEGFSQLLCHYTDFRGLKGILESKCLWAAYTRSLNDGSEDAYGLKVVKDHIAGLAPIESAESLLDHMDGYRQRYFACCFCESSDLLSMWTSYSQRGGGFCIEFEGAGGVLACMFPPFRARFSFALKYGSAMPSPIDTMVRFLVGFALEGTFESDAAASWVRLLALNFKHPAFSHEREHRIIILNPPVGAMKFRAGAVDVKPYVELHPTFDDGKVRLPVKRIVIGPTLRNDDTMIEVVKLMLESYGLPDVPVVSCGIPYRL